MRFNRERSSVNYNRGGGGGESLFVSTHMGSEQQRARARLQILPPSTPPAICRVYASMSI